VIDGAMSLFADGTIEEVTVKDIAAAVEMTPAAVYYHFASKEQVLIEGMQQFREVLVEQIRANMPPPKAEDGLGPLLHHMVAWTAEQGPLATVYFVSSIGLNQTVEALRRETRVELVELFRTAVKNVRGRLGKAEAGVIGVSLVSLLETSLASMLNADDAYRGIGARRFADEVATIGNRLAGLD
jgi:AcrR family transcriptional regulator